MRVRHGSLRMGLIIGAGILLLGPLVYLLVLAAGGERLIGYHTLPRIRVAEHDLVGWLILLLVVALAALVSWALSERARARLAVTSASEREAYAAERREAERMADAWRAEREWNRRLREQITELQHAGGALGRLDVHDLVLEVTLRLVEAEKGLLLTRGSDRAADRGLDVLATSGFEHDPSDSHLARRFAREVMARDHTVREDDPRRLEPGEGTAGDAEVENLLAIPIYLRDDFHGVIVCANRDGGFAELDDEVLLAVGDHAGAVLQNASLHGELRAAYLQTIRTLASVIEVKDPELRGHSDAVAGYVSAVADGFDFEPRRRQELVFGALLHDVGKIGISERILLKPGALTDEERAVMQLHPRIGEHLLRQIPALHPIAPAVLHHHERFDGTGYPDRLSGEEIPIEARIIAVADTFSAMTATRPYREAVPVEHACDELERCAGAQFDPDVVRLFVEAVRRHAPEPVSAPVVPPDPELSRHRRWGSYVLGGGAFGMTDSLTLLLSHRRFHETVQGEARHSMADGHAAFAVLVVELTGLGEINRREGYAAGDAALQLVADAARRAAARSGGLAFRLSGRHIALVLPGLSLVGAESLAVELAAELATGPDGAIGVAAWQPGESAELLVERALRDLAGDGEAVPSPPRPSRPAAAGPAAGRPVGGRARPVRPA